MSRMLEYFLNRLLAFLFALSPLVVGPRKINSLKVVDVKTQSLILRVYAPLTNGLKPTLVYYHGGGWMWGGIKAYDRVMRFLAYHGECVVVCVNSRKAPTYKFPTQVNDALAGYKWVLKNVQRYKGDASKLILGGDSAGGNLALVTLFKIRKLNIIKPKLLILIYPLVDLTKKAFEEVGGKHRKKLFYKLCLNRMEYVAKSYTNKLVERESELISVNRVTHKLKAPKTLIIAAEKDPLTWQINKLRKNLSKRNKDILFKKYKGTVHGFINLAGISTRSGHALSYISKFIKGSKF
jgi:acetyl esterase